MKLRGVHPQLVAAITRVINACAALGLDLRVTDGVRTVAQQQALYAQGRTIRGPNANSTRPLGDTVTNADGVIKKSNHQPHVDGFGYAVDCTFFLSGKPSWDPSLPWTLYGEMVEQQGLKWGGRWLYPVDRPHAELSEPVILPEPV